MKHAFLIYGLGVITPMLILPIVETASDVILSYMELLITRIAVRIYNLKSVCDLDDEDEERTSTTAIGFQITPEEDADE